MTECDSCGHSSPELIEITVFIDGNYRAEYGFCRCCLDTLNRVAGVDDTANPIEEFIGGLDEVGEEIEAD